MVKVSVTSKLDGIKSWSLQALDTCPGSLKADGTLVDACQGCYATTGNYRFPNVKAPRLHNREDWQRDEWVADMVAMLQNQVFFRWFDSGDMYSVGLAMKILQVMEQTPHCSHWLPTRMHKFSKFGLVIYAMSQLPNVVVRLSSDSVQGALVEGLPEWLQDVPNSTIVPSHDEAPAAFKVCEAYQHEGKCNGCRACWSKDVRTVAYVAHGQKMAGVIARAA